jgi:capsular exopolysaccharide synthesis family protein
MNLVTLNAPSSPAAEAYRTLRSNLYFAAREKPMKTLVVVSPDANTDAALALANLAVSMAQSERTVIVVDANLRQPALHKVFDMPNVAGLVNLLDEVGSEPELNATGIDGLRVMTAGAPVGTASDALSSQRMDQIIARLAGMADIVLFAAPPVTQYSDAAVLSSKVDGALLVVGAGKTRRDSAQSARDILTRAHANLIGAVMLGGK